MQANVVGRVRPRLALLRGIGLNDVLPYGILAALAVLQLILDPRLASLSWLGITTNEAFPLLLATVAETLVLLTGGIDLSVAGIISVVSCIAATHLPAEPLGILLVSCLLLLLGLAAGAVNGALIVYLRLQPFIATLATWSIWSGVALWILPIPGGTPPSLLEHFATGRLAGVPTTLLGMVLVCLFWLLFRRTRSGLSIYAIGSNARSAHANGIRVEWVQILVYMLSGGIAALAGLYDTAYFTSGSPVVGNDYVLTAVAAAVIGGTRLSGGKGGVGGSVVGALILTLISNLLLFLGVTSYWTSLVNGILLILVVVLASLEELLAAGGSRR